ncbi:cyclin related protein, putative [Plasmodium gallinaceum]|uniref:Cyclin related protein, putative n=1 Tax=Plasmodium gallinaceum TaxID=5849 RepID=A0A1J1GMJ0_PLAGA|nr:cyclin related protein, putative [Plasmodium gallinaceum]CRG93580.1 cyclin related protein, putative [Plasmodium gallinaceum]
MNQVSVKPKFKAEFVNNENKGVRFMNKTKNNQNTISKNTNVQNLLLPQKNTYAKNSNLKLRTNNNTFNHPPKLTFKNSQNAPHKNFQAPSTKVHNELRYEEKKTLFNTRNTLHDDSKKNFFNKSTMQNKNEEKYNDRKNVKKSFNDNNSLRKNDNNTRLTKAFNTHSTNNISNNPAYNIVYNIQNKEIENNKNDNVNNSENFIPTYSSPTKRKYETFENINKNDEKDNKEMKTQNKRFAQKNYNIDNNFNIECNKNFNNNNILNNTNENMNVYSKYSNDNLFNRNNLINKCSDKNIFYNKNKNETLNSSYPIVNVIKTYDNFNSNSLGRNYTNYERLINNNKLINNHNYELNHKHYFKEKNAKFNLENNKNKNNTEFMEQFNNHKNENHNNIYYLNDPIAENDNKNLNYLTETNSEKIMNNTSNENNNDNFNSCVFDRLSEENFNSYMKRKIDKSDDITIKDIEKFDTLNNSSNKNISNNSKKFSNLLKNNLETNKIKCILNNEKIMLRNNIIETNNADLKNLSNSQAFSEASISNNMENYKEKLTHLKYNGMNRMSKSLNQNELRDTTNKKINIDTYKSNDCEYIYFQNIINNIDKCNNVEKDIDTLCENVMNINDYSLNFNYENECINDILNLSNNVSDNIQNIQQIIYNKKKVVQDKRNIVNEEYENMCQKLKDCESIFCDTNEETGEKKLKVFYEIDEKKNILKNKYEMKKMLLKKAQYKIDKLQEYTEAIKLKTLAISKRYKKTFLLIEELFRLKIIKDKENELEVCLIPKNTETDMWHRLQLDKNEITSDSCDYLWSQIESFVDKETFNNYF